MSTMGCVLWSTVTKITILSRHQSKDDSFLAILFCCSAMLTLILQLGFRESYITHKLIVISSHDHKGHIIYTFVSRMTDMSRGGFSIEQGHSP